MALQISRPMSIGHDPPLLVHPQEAVPSQGPDRAYVREYIAGTVAHADPSSSFRCRADRFHGLGPYIGFPPAFLALDFYFDASAEYVPCPDGLICQAENLGIGCIREDLQS